MPRSNQKPLENTEDLAQRVAKHLRTNEPDPRKTPIWQSFVSSRLVSLAILVVIVGGVAYAGANVFTWVFGGSAAASSPLDAYQFSDDVAMPGTDSTLAAEEGYVAPGTVPPTTALGTDSSTTTKPGRFAPVTSPKATTTTVGETSSNGGTPTTTTIPVTTTSSAGTSTSSQPTTTTTTPATTTTTIPPTTTTIPPTTTTIPPTTTTIPPTTSTTS